VRILIVSTFFPPTTSIASLRPYSWAKWWSRAGHDVTVLTTRKKPRPSDSAMPFDGFAVVELPVPLYEHLSRRLGPAPAVPGAAPAGVPAGDLVGAPAGAPTGASAPAPWDGLARRVARSTLDWFEARGAFASCRFPDLHDLWAPRATAWGRRSAWDVVVSTGGPYSVHRVGHALKEAGAARVWVVDWRDLWTRNHIYPGIAAFWAYERHLERAFHRRADLITTVTEPWARRLRGVTDTRVEVILNGIDTDDYATLPLEPFFDAGPAVRIAYTGTLYVDRQDPTPLFAALGALASSGRIRAGAVEAIFAGDCDAVVGLAAAHGAAGFVRDLGMVPRRDALRIQRDADVLLYLEFQREGFEGILPGKLFEYLYWSKPIWVVGAPCGPTTASLLQDRTGTVFGHDVDRIQRAILDLVAKAGRHGVTVEASGGSAAQASGFTRRAQAERLLSVIRELG
jgi:glycosyltransferase involved in cell wall biosynthesis